MPLTVAAKEAAERTSGKTAQTYLRLYQEAAGKTGTLAEVEGGHCVSHGFCAAKFACIGCI